MGRLRGWPPSILTPVPTADIKRGDGPIITEFIEALCPQVKDSVGGRAGEPLILRPWQKRLVERMYARRADGRYRARTSLVYLPRKNGKSMLGSGLALYSLLMGPRGGEVYSIAAEKEQARIVFGTAKRMIESSPELADQTRLYRDAIEVPATGSVYRVLSAESYSKEGLNPHCVIADEVHAMPNRELWDVMQLAQAARHDAQMIGITTPGVKSDSTGQDSIAFQLWQYGQKVASGEIDDPSFFMAAWGAPEDAVFTDPKVWKAANPGYGDLQDPEDFASAVKRTPENEFRTKRLGTWTSAQTAWLPSGAWDALAIADEVDRDTPVVVGFDGSYANDSTALVGCTVEDTPRVFLIAAWERRADDRHDWRVPISEVEHEVMSLAGRFRLVELACDPYRWAREMQSWAEIGLPVVEYNTASLARMVPATAKFYDAVLSEGLAHDHAPLLRRHLDNCVVRVDAKGPRITKDHKSSPRKIDAAVAAVIAFDRATSHREDPPAPEVNFY
jgi:phage terminase large subunit-like protein